MTEIDKALFGGSEKLHRGDYEQAVIGNTTSDPAAALRRFGWDGSGCSCIALTLDADNEKVGGATFLVRGPVDGKTVAVEANKIWPGASSDVTLTLKFSDASIFTFSDGSLGSDIVAQERIQHCFYLTKEGRPPTPILEADYGEWGLKKFAARLTACLSKNTSAKAGVVVKYTIILYPASAEELLERYEMAQSPAWPGLRIMDGHLPLLPRPTDNWGCPIVPLVVPGGNRKAEGQLPDADELKRAIAHVMARTVVAETGRTGNAVLNKWEKMAGSPDELTVKRGDLAWPRPTPTPPSNNGKIYTYTRVGAGREGGGVKGGGVEIP